MKYNFPKIALNHVLRLRPDSWGQELSNSSGIMDLENTRLSIMQKHWKYRITVPMSYITFVEANISLGSDQGAKQRTLGGGRGVILIRAGGRGKSLFYLFLFYSLSLQSPVKTK